MARRITAVTTITPTATADTTNLVDASYPFLVRGGAATQQILIWEISMNGQEPSTSKPTYMIFAADSTVGTGTNTMGTGQTDAPVNLASTSVSSAVIVGNSNATTKPQRSSTLHLQNCSLNAYGGLYFWRANQASECIQLVGASANTGEVSLSAFTGGTPGPLGGHLIYEPI